MAMDWFSWLSKTGLEPSLVYEYGLAFAHNELEEDDIAHFDHEFLQSMGISIAKHRLEILKLAKKEKRLISSRPMSRLIAMIKKTQKFVVKYVHAWVHRDESAIIVVPRKAYGKRWRGALLKRNKRMMVLKQRRLMITNGNSMVGRASPVVYDHRKDDVHDDRMDQGLNGADKVDGEVGWSNRVDEIRWASMFQNLKPT